MSNKAVLFNKLLVCVKHVRKQQKAYYNARAKQTLQNELQKLLVASKASVAALDKLILEIDTELLKDQSIPTLFDTAKQITNTNHNDKN
jgi:bisphosphoglycerate-dependent phosphoglycerate mutase